jgi:hypothetical protein
MERRCVKGELARLFTLDIPSDITIFFKTLEGDIFTNY